MAQFRNMSDFIGLKVDNESSEICLCFPEFIKDYTPFQNIELEIISFYKLLKKYKSKSNTRSVKEEDNTRLIKKGIDQSNSYFSLLELYLYLINDYKKYGPISISQKQLSFNKGKINWRQTTKIDNQIVVDDSVIYPYLIREYNANKINENFILIYFKELLRASKILEVNLDISNIIMDKLNFKIDKENKSVLLRSAKKRISNTRFNNIIDVLIMINDSEYNKNKKNVKYYPLYYVEKFDNIWEEMLREAVFSRPNKYNKLLHEGSYVLFNENINKAKYRPELDVVVEYFYKDKNYIIILDAKNYWVQDSENIINLPRTSDLGKQYLYKHFLASKLNVKKEYIINAFVFPAVLSNESIKYLGYYKFNSKFNKDEDILCFHMDFISLRERYLYPRHNYRDKIMEFIIDTYYKLK